MTKERFWVLGGEYACLKFERLKDGTQQMLGPFETRDEASAVWKRVSAENSSRANARFSIAAERLRLPG